MHLKAAIALVAGAVLAMTIAVAAEPAAKPAQDKYTVKVPGGLAFSEFRGYESWQTISVSHNGPRLAVILGARVVMSPVQGRHSGQWQAVSRWRKDGEGSLGAEEESRAAGQGHCSPTTSRTSISW